MRNIVQVVLFYKEYWSTVLIICLTRFSLSKSLNNYLPKCHTAKKKKISFLTDDFVQSAHIKLLLYCLTSLSIVCPSSSFSWRWFSALVVSWNSIPAYMCSLFTCASHIARRARIKISLNLEAVWHMSNACRTRLWALFTSKHFKEWHLSKLQRMFSFGTRQISSNACI